MIADIDASLIRAFARRRRYRLNPSLYVHAEPVEMDDLAKAFAFGDSTDQMRLLRRFYLTMVVPYLAARGDDSDPREALYADTEVISALARRCRFSTKVIARKRVECPIKTVLPLVVFLKYLRSSEICQGSVLLTPI